MEQLMYGARDTAEALGATPVTADATSRAERPPRLLLTVEEAAERIGICRSNMFKLIRQGEIQSVKVGPAAPRDARLRSRNLSGG